MAKIFEALRNTFGNPQNKAKKKLTESGIPLTTDSLLQAIDNGDNGTLALLLEAEVSPTSGDANNIPVIRAVVAGNSQAVEHLASAGANVNQADAEGKSPLVHAILKGDSAVAASLIRAGANVDARDNAGLSAVMLCARRGRADILKDLINAGADVNVQNHETKETALIMAAQNGNREIVEILLKNAITSEDRDAKDKKGMTALGWAVKNGHVSVAELLCEKKANVNVQDASGQTPLMYASTAENQTMVQLLLQYGAVKQS